jgi:hypothetical protein
VGLSQIKSLANLKHQWRLLGTFLSKLELMKWISGIKTWNEMSAGTDPEREIF